MKFKKIIAFILALSMVLSVPVLAFAEDTTAEETTLQESVTQENIPEEEVTDTVIPETNDPNETVATLSLCSNIYVWPISGHTWIYVHNNSDEPIQMGLYEVLPDQGVSVGAFSFSVNDGWGLYYNIEAYKENEKNRMDNVRSISTELNAEEVAKLSRKLKEYPNYWGFVANCATFSFSMWNSVTNDGFFSLLIPAISDFMIMVRGGKKGVLEMYQPPREQVFRQKGFGDEAHLVLASDYSVS